MPARQGLVRRRWPPAKREKPIHDAFRSPSLHRARWRGDGFGRTGAMRGLQDTSARRRCPAPAVSPVELEPTTNGLGDHRYPTTKTSTSDNRVGASHSNRTTDLRLPPFRTTTRTTDRAVHRRSLEAPPPTATRCGAPPRCPSEGTLRVRLTRVRRMHAHDPPEPLCDVPLQHAGPVSVIGLLRVRRELGRGEAVIPWLVGAADQVRRSARSGRARAGRSVQSRSARGRWSSPWRGRRGRRRRRRAGPRRPG